MQHDECTLERDGRCEYRADDQLSTVITAALAARTDVDPLTLPPLYDSVDVEALTRLCRSAAPANLCVRFDHAGHSVEVDGDGAVAVEAAD